MIILLLGEGSFGVVQLVKNKTYMYKLENPQQQQSFFREIESFSKVKNPAVLLIGFCLQDFKKHHLPTIITDYIPKGSLGRMISSKHFFISFLQFQTIIIV